MTGYDRFSGTIGAGAFEGGDNVVVGCWGHSPLGAFVDVMWIRPDGRRSCSHPAPRQASSWRTCTPT